MALTGDDTSAIASSLNYKAVLSSSTVDLRRYGFFVFETFSSSRLELYIEITPVCIDVYPPILALCPLFRPIWSDAD